MSKPKWTYYGTPEYSGHFFVIVKDGDKYFRECIMWFEYDGYQGKWVEYTGGSSFSWAGFMVCWCPAETPYHEILVQQKEGQREEGY